ncbi:hypothetical protein EVAR_75505_1 [Eumeta japonica]|uniref:Uncharacterized protein n=1 Tax=Eumeta variegata TaxID=151549 RepID=A0A4C1UIR8_EUMVA|nr:hypothetical protein EVAR_75505_1 [Eumeta japonica]
MTARHQAAISGSPETIRYRWAGAGGGEEVLSSAVGFGDARSSSSLLVAASVERCLCRWTISKVVAGLEECRPRVDARRRGRE